MWALFLFVFLLRRPAWADRLTGIRNVPSWPVSPPGHGLSNTALQPGGDLILRWSHAHAARALTSNYSVAAPRRTCEGCPGRVTSFFAISRDSPKITSQHTLPPTPTAASPTSRPLRLSVDSSSNTKLKVAAAAAHSPQRREAEQDRRFSHHSE
ncbi:hypothetical protein LZ30DRAFT_684480 [Colletotrichum cereale]|nr:hypothetical protein LZ30DRAFT_684480 [Colletotrichum cereale]